MAPYLWMLVSAAAFACMSELAHALNDRCHWMIVALARTSLVLAFTAALATARRTQLVFWRPPTLWLRSLTGSVSLLCTFYAFKNLPASDVIAITNMFPIWVAVLSWPVLGERPGPEVWIAVVCSVSGALLINWHYGPEATAMSGADRVGGALAAGVSSVLSAVVVIGLNLLHRIPSQAIVVHFSGVATVFCLVAMCLPFARVESSHFTALDGRSIGLLAALGLSATVGQIFLTKAFAAAQASKVAVVALSQVVMCLLFELFSGVQRFTPASLSIKMVGMLLVIGPTAWMLLRREEARATATGDAEYELPPAE